MTRRRKNNPKTYTLKQCNRIGINGQKFTPIPNQLYANDYLAIVKDIQDKKVDEYKAYRQLLKNDLWFMVYFGLGTSIANHPFWIDSCREVQDGPDTDTLDIWARDHGKSTIITIAETIQDILNDPTERICIYSYTKDLAKVFYEAIRLHLETSLFLKTIFPDILYQNVADSPQWTKEGLVVKRPTPMKEATVEPWGLTEGMPTGRHFTKRVYDDISTADLVRSPVIMGQIRFNFTMSQNTGSRDRDRQRVVGTPYHHEDVIMFAKGLKKPDGSPAFLLRKKPATKDGTFSGEPVWLTQEQLDFKKMDRKIFASQQLLDPTPREDERLPYEYIKHVTAKDLPSRLIKFIVVDPAGDKGDRAKHGREADSWAIWCVGVEPTIQEVGASKIFILDGFVAPMRWDEGVKAVVQMYLRNGWIHKLGVEKVGMQTAEIHISNALRAKGRLVTVENKMLHILRPSGRSKIERVEGNVGPPLRHGLIHILDNVSPQVRDRLREEMERWPMWRDDALDGLAYVWDLMTDMRFGLSGQAVEAKEKEKDLWDRVFDKRNAKKGPSTSWMMG